MAMKGHPCSGKTTLARVLAQEFRCPLLHHDDVRSRIASHQQPHSSIQTLNQVSFQIICQIAMTQLTVRLPVVIDSSLSSRAHLDQLLQLSAFARVRLILVECRAYDDFEWRKRLEHRRKIHGKCWYNPSTWEDDLPLNLSDEFLDYDTGDVTVLVVDSTAYVNRMDLSAAVYLLGGYRGRHRVELHKWSLQRYRNLERDEAAELDGGGVAESTEVDKQRLITKTQRSRHWNDHFHSFKISDDRKHDDAGVVVTCRKCQQPISGPPYKCTLCDLTLHKQCAESPEKNDLLPNDDPPFLRSNWLQYSFAVTQICDSCQDNGYEYNLNCVDCLFQTHLKCDTLPTILHHNCHEHPLNIVIQPILGGPEFLCDACGDLGKHFYYECTSYGCGFHCHVSCGLLKPRVKHRDHEDHLTLSHCLGGEDPEDLYRDVCGRRRNVKHWMYYCADCDYSSHLHCMILDA